MRPFAYWGGQPNRRVTGDVPGQQPLWPTLLVIFVCLTLLGLQATMEWRARVIQVQETKTFLINLTSSLTQHAEDTIEIADTEVGNIVDRIEASRLSQEAFAQLERGLVAQVAAGARYRSVNIIDAAGNWLGGSLLTKGDNVLDRAFFRHHRDSPDRKLFIGIPIQIRVSGQQIITVSRRLQSADGGFAGVVFAAIGLSYFTSHYASDDLGTNTSVLLAMTDGTLLAQHPASATAIDAAQHFTVVHRSDRYPLVVAVSMLEVQALAGWRDNAISHMAISIVLIGDAGLLCLCLIRHGQRSQAAEARLRESEERCRLLLQSNVTEALYLLDPAGNIETWNASAERIKGFTSAEIIGQHFAMFFTPEDIARGEPARVLAQARDKGRFSGEAWRVRKDGSLFLASIAIDAIRRHDGTLRGFVKVARDVTSQRIEDAQRTIIIEAAPNGMMIVDEGGVITLANSQVERIFGYPDGALVGQLVEILVPEAFRAAHGTLRSAFTSGRSDQGMASQRQFAGRKRDGGIVTIEIMLSPVKTPRGRIVVASLFDVTDRVRLATERQKSEMSARRAAEDANQAKSRFLAVITHELRTPLHGILGYAELLNLEGDLNPTQSERLEVMMASGQYLLGMINAVLDLSQIEADQLELQPVAVDLPDLLRACLNVVRPAADAKGLALALAPAAPLRAFADPMRLRQVLINLLGNAVKFTPSGTIEVRQIEAGAYIRLEVVDTGPGIRAIHRTKLFQTFERLNAQAVSGIEGAGLGLAIAARLVRLMQGQIGYADNPGGGSVFWIELPARNAAPLSGMGAAAPLALTRRQGLRVLVVDDEALNRSIADGFLRFAGHEVVCVDSGAAAIAAAGAADFDAVLMDIRMPYMNGMEATRRIRELPGPRGDVRVVAATAQAFAQQIEACRQAGMNSHVSKPFTQAVLLAAIEEIAFPLTHTPHPTTQPIAMYIAADDECPLFDRTMFDEITETLGHADAQEHLRSVIARGEALLAALRGEGMPARAGELVEDAHRFAGSAGTFGLRLVAAAARQFEVAAETNATETEATARQLAVAIEESMTIVRNELAAQRR